MPACPVCFLDFTTQLSQAYTHPYWLAIVSLNLLIHSIHSITSTTTKFNYY